MLVSAGLGFARPPPLDHHCSFLLFFPSLPVSLSPCLLCMVVSAPLDHHCSFLLFFPSLPVHNPQSAIRNIIPSSLLQRPSSRSLSGVEGPSLVPSSGVPRPIFRRPSSHLQRPSSRSLSGVEGPSLAPPSMVHTDKSASHPVSVSRSGRRCSTDPGWFRWRR